MGPNLLFLLLLPILTLFYLLFLYSSIGGESAIYYYYYLNLLLVLIRVYKSPNDFDIFVYYNKLLQWHPKWRSVQFQGRFKANRRCRTAVFAPIHRRFKAGMQHLPQFPAVGSAPICGDSRVIFCLKSASIRLRPTVVRAQKNAHMAQSLPSIGPVSSENFIHLQMPNTTSFSLSLSFLKKLLNF